MAGIDATKKPPVSGGDFDLERVSDNIVKTPTLVDPMPCGPQLALVRTTLRAGPNGLADIPARMKATRSKALYTVVEDRTTPNSRIVTMKTDTMGVQVFIPNFEGLKSRSNGTQALFALYTEMLNDRGAPDVVPEDAPEAEIADYKLSFHIDTLVERGIYSSRKTARRGFLTESLPLKLIFIKWQNSPKSRRAGAPSAGSGSLFGNFLIEEDGVTCTVTFCPYVDWKEIFKQFSVRPRYWYRLTQKAKELVEHILELASWHNRMKQIVDKGYFDLSLNAVINAMFLPAVRGCERPTQLIYSPVLKAVKENNDASCQAFKSDVVISGDGKIEGDGLHLSVLRDERGTILGVRSYFAGEMRRRFSDQLASIATKKIEESPRHRPRKRKRDPEGGRLEGGAEKTSHEDRF